ncbi:piggyBac transposable element-derived protein 4-like [Sipha flava]|uniref:PiggyBac transposable element-derived protein 4-like n=1 Tax=Sipha flava TaxID=143950 RepID=A0A8B8FQE8_9HEMI|nr:piggyBac transposable element-derived protein 4-like [Sipha flava]
MKCSHRSSEDLWQSDGTGADLFACIMSERRFRFLLRCIRFDEIRGQYACVDEKLQSFRGRCSFQQYMPNKPVKYGIKIFALCDNVTYYTSNLEIYAGKQPDGPFSIDNSASEVVKRLVSPISKTGRNITADNWFASISLAEELLKNHNLTLVATIKKK